MESLVTDEIEILAHRGFADEYPENTLRAIRESSRKADWVEIDVRRCASGEIVVCHDRELDRLTGEPGIVDETPWSELRKRDVLDSGEGIPRLESAFEATPDDVGLMIELKQPRVAAAVIDIASEYENRFALSASELLMLARARGADPEVSAGLQLTGAIYSDFRKRQLGIELAGELDLQFVTQGYECFLDPSFVEYVHDLGVAIRGDALNGHPSEAVWQELADAGVDHVVVDSYPSFLD